MWLQNYIALIWITSVVIVSSVFLYGLHTVKKWQFRCIPGPRAMWLIGNLGSFASGRGIHVLLTEWARQYGPIYMAWFGYAPILVVSEPQLGRLLALRNVERLALKGAPDLFTGRDHKIQSSSLAVVNDKTQHRDIKNAWLPIFNSASLDVSSSLINKCAEQLCSHLAQCAAIGKETNIWRDYGRLTMGVVGTVAFGVDLFTQVADNSKNSEAAKELISSAETLFAQNPFGGDLYAGILLLFPFALPLLKPVAKRFPDAQMRKMAAARHRLYKTSTALLKTARKQAAQDGKDTPQEEVVAAAPQAGGVPSCLEARKQARAVKPGSFMHLLMRASHTADGSPFSDDEIIGQAFIFLLAGYETTANTLAFATHSLAANPDKAAKLLEEIDRELPTGDVTAEHLARMPYVEACVKETLRLYTPAPVLARQLAEDTVIQGRSFPKGTGVMVLINAIHHDPEIYADPELFKPERWLEGTPEYAADKQVPGKWMPFGEGSRVCVGQRLALMEAKIALAHVFRKFTFSLSPGQRPLQTECKMLLKPKIGVFVTPILRGE